ncbi:MAG: protein-disulfide reductase DsbD domain-containing protein [Oceanococcus sp.]
MNLLPIRLFLTLLVSLIPGLSQAGFFDKNNDQSEFLTAEQAFEFEALAIDHNTVQVRWMIEPGHYLYRHRLDIESHSPDRISWQAPAGENYQDEHFGEVEIYHEILEFPINVSGSEREINLKVSWQGCAEAGLCYPPKSRELTLQLPDCP